MRTQPEPFLGRSRGRFTANPGFPRNGAPKSRCANKSKRWRCNYWTWRVAVDRRAQNRLYCGHYAKRGCPMSFGDDQEDTDIATARGRDWPSVRQFNVFLENRLGAMMDLVRRFESSDIRIVSLTVVDS